MTDDDARLATPYRTHTARDLRGGAGGRAPPHPPPAAGARRVDDVGRAARLAGWIHRRRDHGHLIFLDLRDRHGLTQLVVDANESPEAHEGASRLRNEFVVTGEGSVAARLPGTENPRLATGAIELRARSVQI